VRRRSSLWRDHPLEQREGSPGLLSRDLKCIGVTQQSYRRAPRGWDRDCRCFSVLRFVQTRFPPYSTIKKQRSLPLLLSLRSTVAARQDILASHSDICADVRSRWRMGWSRGIDRRVAGRSWVVVAVFVSPACRGGLSRRAGHPRRTSAVRARVVSVSGYTRRPFCPYSIRRVLAARRRVWTRGWWVSAPPEAPRPPFTLEVGGRHVSGDRFRFALPVASSFPLARFRSLPVASGRFVLPRDQDRGRVPGGRHASRGTLRASTVSCDARRPWPAAFGKRGDPV